MSGRMAITLPHDAMARLFEAAPANDLPEVPNHNLCPTNTLGVVTADGGARRQQGSSLGDAVRHIGSCPTPSVEAP